MRKVVLSALALVIRGDYPLLAMSAVAGVMMGLVLSALDLSPFLLWTDPRIASDYLQEGSVADRHDELVGQLAINRLFKLASGCAIVMVGKLKLHSCQLSLNC